MIYVKDTEGNVRYTSVTTFSDGAVGISLAETPKEVHTICLDVDNVIKDLAMFEQVMSLLTKRGSKPTTLILPYVPYARADRQFSKKNSEPLKEFCQKINAYGFSKVKVVDPHSNVTLKLLNNVNVSTQTEAFLKAVEPEDFATVDFFCAPDQGAMEKTRKTSDLLSKPSIFAKKVHNVATGKILSTTLETPNDLSETHVMILDGICDGGGTFLGLADALKLRGVKKISLFVTHGIFSKGLEVFTDKIDKVYTYNIVGNYVSEDDLKKFNKEEQLKLF